MRTSLNTMSAKTMPTAIRTRRPTRFGGAVGSTFGGAVRVVGDGVAASDFTVRRVCSSAICAAALVRRVASSTVASAIQSRSASV
jgi:hypothetical protein